ncbi:hypothetical protein ASG03_13035 [Rhizobium sp. Leaf341]|nr:hypothetical protein ASG03_13035 [Rhizobium sp. Leaf341]
MAPDGDVVVGGYVCVDVGADYAPPRALAKCAGSAKDRRGGVDNPALSRSSMISSRPPLSRLHPPPWSIRHNKAAAGRAKGLAKRAAHA